MSVERIKSPHQLRVEKFMELAGQDVPSVVQDLDDETRLLRAKLIHEEAMKELIYEGLGVMVAWNSSESCFKYEILSDFNMGRTVDGCLDAIVVITGTLSAMGIPDETFQLEVDNNNLAKFGPGGYRSNGTDGNSKGKWIKPPGHKPPRIGEMIEELSKSPMQKWVEKNSVPKDTPVPLQSEMPVEYADFAYKSPELLLERGDPRSKAWVAECKEVVRDMTEEFVIVASTGPEVVKDPMRYIVLDLAHPDPEMAHCARQAAREYAKIAFYKQGKAKLIGEKVMAAKENIEQRKHDVKAT